MREKVVAVRIASKDDMTRVEEELCKVIGSKGKCTLLRSEDFIRLRLCALYDRGDPPMSVYSHNVQVHLSEDKTVSIFLLSTELLGGVEGVVVLGKRADPDNSDCEDD
jgi:hypothetical protein